LFSIVSYSTAGKLVRMTKMLASRKINIGFFSEELFLSWNFIRTSYNHTSQKVVSVVYCPVVLIKRTAGNTVMTFHGTELNTSLEGNQLEHLNVEL